jgi:hypothetical protein
VLSLFFFPQYIISTPSVKDFTGISGRTAACECALGDLLCFLKRNASALVTLGCATHCLCAEQHTGFRIQYISNHIAAIGFAHLNSEFARSERPTSCGIYQCFAAPGDLEHDRFDPIDPVTVRGAFVCRSGRIHRVLSSGRDCVFFWSLHLHLADDRRLCLRTHVPRPTQRRGHSSRQHFSGNRFLSE